MDTLASLLAILAGLLLRLAIPILITALLVAVLHKLDARWQSEAQTPPLTEKPKCWEIKKCPPEYYANCIAGHSDLPCWQVYRLPNGNLREECLTCEVFVDAPVPVMKAEPRRMSS